MPRDGWESVAVLLRPEEAAAIAGLLRSAAIDAEIEGAASAGLFPVAGGLGSVEVQVPVADAARAREIVRASGLLAGPRDAASAAGEASELEWSAPPRAPEPEAERAEAEAREEALRVRERLWGTRSRGLRVLVGIALAAIVAIAGALRGCG
jgi:hypothetical protein